MHTVWNCASVGARMIAVWPKVKHQGVHLSAADVSVLTYASELYLPLYIFALLSEELSSFDKKIQ